eukprot:CAMPEP_0206466302 /NCGR_PEP_ID=MMETSP0324_2-20121206/28376_1 /ASSEMBLY_ACC=CAM_ASM_000836 /TAXON_ID=2866 /ORGANISM="Crypthecodinium cohnii, Strain Seligo" /LENGTH=63 /DNA_ID=CAMNT_0053939389 /DNA_START=178 /DNA_END=366 /DNA_ORIENTATION=+
MEVLFFQLGRSFVRLASASSFYHHMLLVARHPANLAAMPPLRADSRSLAPLGVLMHPERTWYG